MLFFWSTAAWLPGTLNTSFRQITKLVKGAWEGLLLGYHHSSAGRGLAWHAWSWICSLEAENKPDMVIHHWNPSTREGFRVILSCTVTLPRRVAQEHWTVMQVLYWPGGGMWRAAYYLSSISVIRDYLTRSWPFWNSMLLAEVWISTVSL